MRVLTSTGQVQGHRLCDRSCFGHGRGCCRRRGHDAVVQPLADGGEGTLEALGGPNRETVVTGPLGDPVTAEWRMGPGRKSGRGDGKSLGPVARRWRFWQRSDRSHHNGHGGADRPGDPERCPFHHHRGWGLGDDRRWPGCPGGDASPGAPTWRIELKVACDVRTRFVDAATVFGPQKGASKAQVELLRRRLERLAQDYLDQRGIDVTEVPGSGAAGGLAGGLASVGAELADGFDIVAEACGLDELIADADLVITGEGSVDPTSFDGKVVGGVVGLCTEAAVPVVVVAGQVSADAEVPVPVVSLVDAVGLDRAMSDPVGAVTLATASALESA